MKPIKLLLVTLITAGTFFGVRAINNYHADIQFNKLELKSTQLKTKTLEMQYDEALKTLDKSKSTEKQLKEAQERLDKLEKEKQDLKAQLEAKRLKLPSDKVYAAEIPKGNCEEWIAAAGIKDKANARELISRESGCNPNARNPSSGACGVAQELPCGKSGCSLGDGACQVKWMNGYVLARYGSWANAIAFHNANNYY